MSSQGNSCFPCPQGHPRPCVPPGHLLTPGHADCLWLPAPSPTSQGFKGENLFSNSIIKWKKGGVFLKNCIFVLTLYLQVFYKKSLLELELYSSSLSDNLPFPLSDKWKFPLKHLVAPSGWRSRGGGEREEEGGLHSLEASWSLFVERKQICLDASS